MLWFVFYFVRRQNVCGTLVILDSCTTMSGLWTLLFKIPKCVKNYVRESMQWKVNREDGLGCFILIVSVLCLFISELWKIWKVTKASGKIPHWPPDTEKCWSAVKLSLRFVPLIGVITDWPHDSNLSPRVSVLMSCCMSLVFLCRSFPSR